ncbi:MAG: CIA30 family protein [Pseudomonadota bacterium]
MDPTIQFQLVTDTVMGGRSSGTLTRETVQGREAWRMRGTVSLENNGGFIQMAADVPEASGFTGVEFSAIDSGVALGVRPGHESETYNIHLRTSDLTRPWQSYRQSFIAGPEWETHRIQFADFAPHRTDAPLDLSKLRRIGIIAIGREMEADVSVAHVHFY